MGYPTVAPTTPPKRNIKLPSLGDFGSFASSAGSLTNPVSAVGTLLSGLFGGGGPNVTRINAYVSMLQVWYNEAAQQGDVNSARALIYYAQGGAPYPDQMKPQASAFLMQLQQTAPRVYAAATTAGAWPHGQNDLQTANVPRNPDPSLVGTSSVSGIFSGLTGGNKGNSLMLPLLAGGALLFLTRK